MTLRWIAEQNRRMRKIERLPAGSRSRKSQHNVVAEGAVMTLKQARKRFPLVPDEILRWAVENISDPNDLERGLFRLEQAKRLQLKYSA